MKCITKILILGLTLFGFSIPVFADNAVELKGSELFVQEFYNWYSKLAENPKVRPTDTAIKQRASSFSPELIKRLKADSQAQDKVSGEIVGLDFDPFLNAQDIASAYKAGKSASAGNHQYRVPVFGTWNGKKNDKPDVSPQVELYGGKWRFVNFHYDNKSVPENRDLLSVLKALATSRANYPASQKK